MIVGASPGQPQHIGLAGPCAGPARPSDRAALCRGKPARRLIGGCRGHRHAPKLAAPRRLPDRQHARFGL